ncbi:MAG: PrsW family glutamic-type intramembrane protease [bacterium]
MVVGSLAFLNGLAALGLLSDLSFGPRRRLFEINVALGTAIVTMSLGGMLVYQAASSLGKVGSSAMSLPRWKWAAPFMAGSFPLLVAIGQFEVNHPESLAWLFPITNVLIVSLPSLAISLVVAQRYLKFNAWAWPLSWREWSSGVIYGAVGATTVGGIINTLYLIFAGALLIHLKGSGDAFAISDNLPTLPRAWGIAFDISVLSVVAPLNEEFWKGMLVAFFFFRKGGAARCFLWGVLAGAGFNILETFQNSLSIINPAEISQQQLGHEWWLFATARAGTGAIHSAATGFSALGIYGMLRGKPRFFGAYFLGATIHGSWNFLNFTLAGDAILSQAGPDSGLLDVLSVLGMFALFCGCLALLWEMPRRIRDRAPAPIYAILGMVPMSETQRLAYVPPPPPRHTAAAYKDW